MESCILETHINIGNILCVERNNPIGFITQFYGVGLSIAGAVAIVFLIYGGYVIMMSRGNPDNLQKGKSYIYYSIAGLLLAVFGFVFIQIVLVDILKIPGFK